MVRTIVFSSARQDTGRDSTRMLMFKGMREQGFEVHMATTTGVQEKCIDIALAVEMIHYATVPHTYDVGGEALPTAAPSATTSLSRRSPCTLLSSRD